MPFRSHIVSCRRDWVVGMSHERNKIAKEKGKVPNANFTKDTNSQKTDITEIAPREEFAKQLYFIHCKQTNYHLHRIPFVTSKF